MLNFLELLFDSQIALRGNVILGCILLAIFIFYFVHIGFSQQQPKQQQRVPALQRAGRLSVCG